MSISLFHIAISILSRSGKGFPLEWLGLRENVKQSFSSFSESLRASAKAAGICDPCSICERLVRSSMSEVIEILP